MTGVYLTTVKVLVVEVRARAAWDRVWKIKTTTRRVHIQNNRNTVVVGRDIHSVERWKTKRLRNTLFHEYFLFILFFFTLLLLFFLFYFCFTSETKETFDHVVSAEANVNNNNKKGRYNTFDDSFYVLRITA